VGNAILPQDGCVSRFSITVRVYWEDTDAQGIVYYANYFRFMERARSEWLRARGIDQGRLVSDMGLMFSVIDTGLRFLRPARHDDLLDVSARLEFARGARFRFVQEVRRDGQAGDLLCEGHCEAACLDANNLKPRRLPPGLLGSTE
jgi:acyl-CoA thioester hydrolase